MKPTPKRRVIVDGTEYFIGSTMECWHYYKSGSRRPIRLATVTKKRTAAMLDRIAELEAEVEELREKKT